jgi:hypothetical protein
LSIVKCLWLHDFMFSSINIMFEVSFGIQSSFPSWLASVICGFLARINLVVARLHFNAATSKFVRYFDDLILSLRSLKQLQNCS